MSPDDSLRPRVLRGILWGGLTVAVLDILDAFLFYGARGVSPVRILQSISVALLGRAAFSGGATTAALGAFLHCCVAFAIASVYILASQRVPWLVRYAIPLGLAYGVAAYFVMNYVVLPMTHVGLGRFALGPFVNGIIGHALLVGLPVALWARWSASVM